MVRFRFMISVIIKNMVRVQIIFRVGLLFHLSIYRRGLNLKSKRESSCSLCYGVVLGRDDIYQFFTLHSPARTHYASSVVHLLWTYLSVILSYCWNEWDIFNFFNYLTHNLTPLLYNYMIYYPLMVNGIIHFNENYQFSVLSVLNNFKVNFRFTGVSTACSLML